EAAKPSGFAPLKALQNAGVYAEQAQKQREAEAKRQREQMISQTVQQFGGDLDKAVEFLKPKDWEAAQMLTGLQMEHRKQFADTWKAELEVDRLNNTISKERYE